MLRRGLLAAAMTLLSGCGFRPVYMRNASGAAGAAQQELAAIGVDVIPDRPGQLLRQALQERLEGTGVARKYDLGVSYSIAGEGIAILQDNSVSRIRLIARGNWVLRAQDPARSQVTAGSARAIDGYNILNQQFFAADLENEAAQRRLAQQIADQIAIQLAAYFRRHPPASSVV
jgi:LPS-assembly lipoprotein